MCDHLQNICVSRRTVIESRGVDEDHCSSIERELIGELDLGRTRLRAGSERQTRTTREINELEAVE